MGTTLTPNKGLYKITVGTELGTWGPFLNTNEDTLDGALGGSATVVLGGANVTLSAAEYQNTFIFFTGLLTANVTVFFPAVGGMYTVINNCTNAGPGGGVVKLSTIAGTELICAPPGEAQDIMTYGTVVKYRNLEKIGTYVDIAYADVPNWIKGCTTPPYLYCDGSVFSAVTYPNLFTFLATTTLPDMRGRMRAAFNQGTNRLLTASGVNGDILFSGGGASTLVGVAGGGGSALQQLPPICIGGITMIRAG